MVGVSLPCRHVAVVSLIAPSRPARSGTAREQFNLGSGRTGFDDVVLFIGFAAVFALGGPNIVYQSTPRRQFSRVLSANAKQNHLGHITEIKSHPATIRTAVLAQLVPNNIAFV